MTTFTPLVKAIEEKGFRFEIYTNVFNRWGDEVTPETFISVELKPYIWFTWSFHTFLNTETWNRKYNEENQYLDFKGRYNQNNGATQKSIRKEWKALEQLGLK